ncbi:MAG: PaaI family thioesterase [Planctomycetota bacterium]
MSEALQDLLPGNHCFGCGPRNDNGLRLKSYWDGDRTVATFQPSAEHAAGPPHILNGGVIATIIDCHGICTAIADAYKTEGRTPQEGAPIWYATGRMEVDYLRPCPLQDPVELEARVIERAEKKSVVEVTLRSGSKECARGRVIAVRVPPAWRDSRGPADA